MNFWNIFQFCISYDYMTLCYQIVCPHSLWHNVMKKTVEREFWRLWLDLWHYGCHCVKINLIFLQISRKRWIHVHKIDKIVATSWLYCYYWNLILAQAYLMLCYSADLQIWKYLSQCNLAIFMYISTDFYWFEFHWPLLKSVKENPYK